MLDVYPDVFASGILLVPKDLKPGERRAVVVCQHGLEGQPDRCRRSEEIGPARITPSPHSSPIEATSSTHHRIPTSAATSSASSSGRRIRWDSRSSRSLSASTSGRSIGWPALPFVDPKRIAFYGLSYGGKTAMRVPALLDRYCLSICSGDFNEWIYKNASYDFRGSYLYTNEYEMPEFNLGNTFNYAEMAALIAPRPFMVERGHDDGVGVDEWVAYEYAKVRRLYAKLKIPERTAIEFFPGVHEIHGQGTFEFLDRHLRGPK